MFMKKIMSHDYIKFENFLQYIDKIWFNSLTFCELLKICIHIHE